MTPQNSKYHNVGFIGLGIMGSEMAKHILQSGCTLYTYSRTKAKAQQLIELGAIWCDSIAQLAQNTKVIFSIVGFPQDVAEIYLGDHGIVKHAKAGTIVCDMTTSEPSLAQQIYLEAHNKNVHSLDAPVSGGDVGAKNATLSIMVGGEENIFQEILPLFKVMGKNIVYMGKTGAGQHCKMCNQIAIAGTMMGMIESLRYAKQCDLDLNQLLSAISKGAAGSWSLDNLAPRIIKEDFSPGFLIKHFFKDMNIAKKEAESRSLSTPSLDQAIEYYSKTITAGGENLGTQGLYKMWEKYPEW